MYRSHVLVVCSLTLAILLVACAAPSPASLAAAQLLPSERSLGGKLLFVTCSLWPQESAAQADAFAMRNRAARLPAPGQLLPGGEQDHDGLFYALFEKPG